MTKVLYSVDGQVGQDVEMIANYGDGGVYIEFHNGKRELVSRKHIDLGYFAAENKASRVYTGPIPEVGAGLIPPVGSIKIPPIKFPLLNPREIPFPLAEVNLDPEPPAIMNIGEVGITKEMAEEFMEEWPTCECCPQDNRDNVDNDEESAMYKEIERLVNEIEKGNRFREGLKQTIVELHEQLNDKNTAYETFKSDYTTLKVELERANRVIDYITKEKAF